ncbi:hypothetical protein Tco_0705063 [Tanacetum coccineum]|uniref:Uncharacterized protein n=1 Tax=Tanacetum coccineum TaxID=301880 RepID=A0ABQ4Y5F6_9ASTR
MVKGRGRARELEGKIRRCKKKDSEEEDHLFALPVRLSSLRVLKNGAELCRGPRRRSRENWRCTDTHFCDVLTLIRSLLLALV